MIEAVLLKDKKRLSSDATELDSLEDLRQLFIENESLVETSNSPQTRRNSLISLMRHSTFTVHHFWRRFDDRFMRPIFGGRGFAPFVPSSSTSIAHEIR